eukprot:6191788-Pleurochrysis_carterae.AAC.2
MPVTTWTTCKMICQSSELFPEQAATSLLSKVFIVMVACDSLLRHCDQKVEALRPSDSWAMIGL